VPRGHITIHEAEAIDDYGCDAERNDARRLDTEESWDRAPDTDIEDDPRQSRPDGLRRRLASSEWCYTPSD
jgi:hypothetical protein